MIQRLKNLKKRSLIIIAAALVAAIVIACISIAYLQKRNANIDRLQALQKSAREANSEFTIKYKMASDKEKRRFKFESSLKEFWEKQNADSFKTLDEVKKILKEEYPGDYISIVNRDDIYSLLFGEVQNGLQEFDEFVVNSRLNRPATLVMVQFTTNLDPIYYYIEYDGKSYHVVEDKTYDGYGEEYGYVEIKARYLRFEDYPERNGDITEYGYTSDVRNLTYKEVLDYIEKSSDGEILEEPNCWEFYISPIDKEAMENRMLAPNRVDRDFKAKYSGFADRHPDYSEDNPFEDYDEDGILDRVYREYETLSENKGIVNAYLFFGDGNTVTLAKNIWGESFKTQMMDVTNDNNKDICFIQYNENAMGSEYGISIFEYKNGNYVAMKFPQKKYESLEIAKNADGRTVIKCVETSERTSRKESFDMYYRDGLWQAENRRILE